MALLTLFVYLIIRYLIKPLKRVENAVISLEHIDLGAEITGQTAEAMKTLDEYTTSVKQIVDEITESCKRQKEMAEQINSDINKISGVVQSNSATAEESAAASEELSGQAGMLKELVGKFKI